MNMLITLINLAFDLATLVIILQVALSWLINFKVINIENPQAQNLVMLLKRLTDPVYMRLRQYIPPIGGMDFTPLIVLIGLSLLQSLIIGALI